MRRKKQKNGAFTLIELLAVIVILGVILTIGTQLYNSYINSSREKAYRIIENSIRSAAISKLTKYPTLTVGETIVFSAEQLINDKLLNNLTDPVSENFCNEKKTYIKIDNNSNNSLLDKYNYTVCLICSHYESSTCLEENPLNLSIPVIKATSKENKEIKNNGWSYSEYVKLTANYYNFDNKDLIYTWYKNNSVITNANTNSITINETGTYKVNINGKLSKEFSIKFDKTKANLAVSYANSAKTIKISANASDDESGIIGYQYSKDNGNSWTKITTNNAYTYKNLRTDNYKLKVRVINGASNITESETIELYVDETSAPTFVITPSEGWSQYKDIQINYNGIGNYLLKVTRNSNINVKAQECSKVTNKSVICDGKITNNKILANVWYKVTESPKLHLIENTTIITQVNDGNKYFSSSTQSITSIDNTKPSFVDVENYQASQNSIKVTAKAIDRESGIYGYQFSEDNGETWTKIKKTNTYTFYDLRKSTSYNIKIRAINNTYQNNGINKKNYLDSKTIPISTSNLSLPTFTVTPPILWSKDKTVKVNFTGVKYMLIKTTTSAKINVAATPCDSVIGTTSSCTGKSVATNQMLEANTWYKVVSVPTLTYTSSGSILAMITNETTDILTSTQTILNIDPTPPQNVGLTYTKTTKSMTITALGEDNESGIYGYQFSINNGSSWYPANNKVQESKTYFLDNLPKNTTYNVKVRVVNNTFGGNGYVASAYTTSNTEKIITNNLIIPTYTSIPASGWSQSKQINVNFNGEGNYLFYTPINLKINVPATMCETTPTANIDSCNSIYFYGNTEIIGGYWYLVDSSFTFKIEDQLNTTGYTFKAMLNDGKNYLSASTFTVNQIDRTPPTEADFTFTTKSDSITITATGKDPESAIGKYEFSIDDGKTWYTNESKPTTNVYTFNKIKTGTYKVRVRLTNGTSNNEKVNDLNSLITDSKNVTVSEMITPTFTPAPSSGWTRERKVVLKYTKPTGVTPAYYFKVTSPEVLSNYAVYECSEFNGITATCLPTTTAANTVLKTNIWYKITASLTPTLTFRSDGAVITNITDGTNYIDSSTLVVNPIDRTPPDVPTLTYSNTATTLTLTAHANDNESGIIKYQFSNNGGTNWYPSKPQEDPTYTFTNLSIGGSYKMKVRVYNGTYINDSASVTYNFTDSIVESLSTIVGTPTFVVTPANGWKNSKTVKVTFTGTGSYFIKPTVSVKTNITATECENVNGNNFTLTTTKVAANGMLNANTWYKVTSSPTLTMTETGTIITHVTNTINYIGGESITVTQFDSTAPLNADFTYVAEGNQITVTGLSEDLESDIYGYQFYIGTSPTSQSLKVTQTNPTYTFTNLIGATQYYVKVRAINNNYPNLGLTDSLVFKESIIKPIKTTVATPTFTVTPLSGWTNSKTLKVGFSGKGSFFVKPTVNVKTNIAATECESVTNNNFTLATTKVAANGMLNANTWYQISGTPTFTFTKSGTMITHVTDGVTYVSGITYTISEIDLTPPDVPTFTYTNTSKSITVEAIGKDNESGIKGYQFSSNGGTSWTTLQTSPIYTFDNLVKNTKYKIKVRAINNNNPNLALTHAAVYKDSIIQEITTNNLTLPTFIVTPASGWSQNKTVAINFNGEGTYMIYTTISAPINKDATLCTSSIATTCTGEVLPAGSNLTVNKWYKVEENVVIDYKTTIKSGSSATLYAQVHDGKNTTGNATQTITLIDPTAPNIPTFTYTYTTTTITINATGVDSESGITKYEFSIDDGNTWYTNATPTTKSYTFKDLETKNYKLKVRVYNGTVANNTTNTYTDSETKEYYLIGIVEPTFKITPATNWSNKKTIVLTYTKGSMTTPSYYFKVTSSNVTSNYAVYECSELNGTESTCLATTTAANTTLKTNVWYKITASTTPTLTFNESGTIMTHVSDGTNYSNSSSLTVTQIDRTSPNIPTFTYTNTSNGITITANANDSESGIYGYQFSSNGGTNWYPSIPQESPIYTFTNLAVTGTYKLKVRAINKNYPNLAISAANKLFLFNESDIETLTLTPLEIPTYETKTITGWIHDKTVKINYNGLGAYLFYTSLPVTINKPATLCTSVSAGPYTCASTVYEPNTPLVGGKWYLVPDDIEVNITNNSTSLIGRINDGTNYKAASTLAVTNVDSVKPVITKVTPTVTTNTLQLTVSTTDALSGISKIEYSIDDGKTWYTNSTPTVTNYKFTNLPSGIYHTKVRVSDKTIDNSPSTCYTEVSNDFEVTGIIEPIYKVAPATNWAASKTITTTYTKGAMTTPIYYFKVTSPESTINVATYECSELNGVRSTCTTTATKANTILKANTWYKFANQTAATYSPIFTFKESGTIMTHVTDGTNYSNSSSLTVTQVDKTAPTESTFTYTNDSNSITITANGVDPESGITKYQFFNGTTVIATQDSPTFVYKNLGTGTYKIKVRVFNGNYANQPSLVTTYKESVVQTIALTQLDVPIFTTDPITGWIHDKTVNLTYTGLGAKLIKVTGEAKLNINATTCKSVSLPTYICDGEVIPAGTNLTTNIWYLIEENPIINVTKNSTLYATITDSKNYKNSTTMSVTNVDSRVPTITKVTPTITTNSLNLLVSATKSDSPITKYEFSIDNGKTWTINTNTLTNSYMFKGLIADKTYPVKIRVYNSTCSNSPTTCYNTYSQDIKLAEVLLPTFKITPPTGWTALRKITTTYTKGSITTPTYYFKVISDNAIVNATTYQCTELNGATSTCTTTATAANTTLKTNTWYKFANQTAATYSPIFTFKSDGTIITHVSDGQNYAGGATITTSNIDLTAPTDASLTYTANSNSITVTATGKDLESGIGGYQFSNNGGSTWTTYQTNPTYTFSNLTAGTTYSVLIRAINNNYPNDALSTTTNYKQTAITKITTTALIAPVITTIEPTTWAHDKTYTIAYNGLGAYLFNVTGTAKANQDVILCSAVGSGTYTCDGETIKKDNILTPNKWYMTPATTNINFTTTGTINARVNDGKNIKTAPAYTVSKVDGTAPLNASFTYTKTSKSISITATATDSESGIYKYEFSKDGGITWQTNSALTTRTYTYSNITSGTYDVKVRITNNTYVNSLETASTTISEKIVVEDLSPPTYTITPSIDWSTQKTVKVEFEKGYTYYIYSSVDVTTSIAATTCSSVTGTTSVCTGPNVAANGRLLAKTWYKITANPTITFIKNAYLITHITDGINYKTASVLNITNIDITPPEEIDFTYKQNGNSINIIANSADSDSGIYGYQFSKDGGITWSDTQTSNKYSFTDLESKTYNFVVKSLNNTYPNSGEGNNSIISGFKTLKIE